VQQALITGLGVEGRWFAGTLPAVLESFRQVRNPGSHVAVVAREPAIAWRDRLLGVGEDGILVRLTRCRPPGAVAGRAPG
jgi:hypothetical protein